MLHYSVLCYSSEGAAGGPPARASAAPPAHPAGRSGRGQCRKCSMVV